MTSTEEQQLQRARMLSETARIPWRELQRFFAAGSVIAVALDLDLVEVALAMAEDDKARVSGWMAAGQLGLAGDTEAAAWFDADAMMWAVVLSPWVLVQPARD
ncbi:MAG: DUF2288 domain-containing protein [Porticoccaceae bacterium]